VLFCLPDTCSSRTLPSPRGIRDLRGAGWPLAGGCDGFRGHTPEAGAEMPFEFPLRVRLTDTENGRQTGMIQLSLQTYSIEGFGRGVWVQVHNRMMGVADRVVDFQVDVMCDVVAIAGNSVGLFTMARITFDIE
jgi:hypothetical protein